MFDPQTEGFCGVVASFVDMELRRAAVRELAAEGWAWEIYGPFADEALSRELLPPSESVHNPVRLWTLLGAIAGTIAAFSMTIWMSSNWPLVAGGKPTVSWPPFICVAFELTVLLGSLACMTGMFLRARLPRLLLPAAFQTQFLRDRFGLYIGCTREQAPALRRRLLAAGAADIWSACNEPRGRLEATAPLHEPECAE